MCRPIALFWLMTVVICSPLVAAPSESSTMPTTASVTEDSPKAALKAYNAAMRAGDVAGMVALQQATNEDERRVARCCAQSDLEVGRLIKAARDKFGEDGAKKVSVAINDMGDGDIDAAEENVKDDHGGVTFAGSSDPSPLVRVNGKWKVDVAGLIKQFNGPAEGICTSVVARGSAAKVVTQELVAGHYADVDACVDALKASLKQE